jgi:uncharacterized protein YbjQ (UPF0145 family)
MTDAAGLRPLGQVAGTCVYHTSHLRGLGTAPGQTGEIYRFHLAVEAVRESRRKALRRLLEAARALGADVVTGIRVTHEERESDDRAHDPYGGIVVATANGYALARQQAPRARVKPLPVTVSVGEYWKLRQGGWAATGMVMTTVMTGCADSGRSTAGELAEASGMVQAAWKFAEEDIWQQARAARGTGVLDVKPDSRKWLADPALFAFKMILTVTGTVVAPLVRENDPAGPASQRRLVITPVRHLA